MFHTTMTLGSTALIFPGCIAMRFGKQIGVIQLTQSMAFPGSLNWLYATYHLLWELETTIDQTLTDYEISVAMWVTQALEDQLSKMRRQHEEVSTLWPRVLLGCLLMLMLQPVEMGR